MRHWRVSCHVWNRNRRSGGKGCCVERKLLEPFHNSLPARGEWPALNEASSARSTTEEVESFDCDVNGGGDDDVLLPHYHRQHRWPSPSCFFGGDDDVPTMIPSGSASFLICNSRYKPLIRSYIRPTQIRSKPWRNGWEISPLCANRIAWKPEHDGHERGNESTCIHVGLNHISDKVLTRWRVLAEANITVEWLSIKSAATCPCRCIIPNIRSHAPS